MKSKKQASEKAEKGNEKKKVKLHRSLKANVVISKSGDFSNGFLAQLQNKVKGSKFRWINEQLYTQSGEDSLRMIKEDESLFDVYHQGFREQVTRWPLVPVDVFISILKYPSSNRFM